MCSACFLSPTTHAEYKTTPPLVSFCVRCVSLALQHIPSTKPHPHWCGFMFGVFPSPYKATTHAEHETTPSLVRFHARCLSFTLQHTPSTKPHQRGSGFVFGVFTSPYIKYISIFINYIYMYSILNIYSVPAGELTGIPHPSSRDGISAGTGAGQSKTPRGTPVSITSRNTELIHALVIMLAVYPLLGYFIRD